MKPGKPYCKSWGCEQRKWHLTTQSASWNAAFTSNEEIMTPVKIGSLPKTMYFMLQNTYMRIRSYGYFHRWLFLIISVQNQGTAYIHIPYSHSIHLLQHARNYWEEVKSGTTWLTLEVALNSCNSHLSEWGSVRGIRFIWGLWCYSQLWKHRYIIYVTAWISPRNLTTDTWKSLITTKVKGRSLQSDMLYFKSSLSPRVGPLYMLSVAVYKGKQENIHSWAEMWGESSKVLSWNSYFGCFKISLIDYTACSGKLHLSKRNRKAVCVL